MGRMLYDKLNCMSILICTCLYNLLEDRHIDDITFNNISFFIREKQIDFVLLWVSTVMY